MYINTMETTRVSLLDTHSMVHYENKISNTLWYNLINKFHFLNFIINILLPLCVLIFFIFILKNKYKNKYKNKCKNDF
jgi:hypothetical protein